jgi:hypothetical protein
MLAHKWFSDERIRAMKRTSAIAWVVVGVNGLFFFNSTSAEENCSPHGMDMCAVARELQQAAAPNLPQQTSRLTTIAFVMADGKRLITTNMINMTAQAFDAGLVEEGITTDTFIAEQQDKTQKLTCNDAKVAKYNRNGLELEWPYVTQDGIVIGKVTVASCP